MDVIDEALGVVGRTGFLPRGAKASYDGPIPIGHGQTNSQPRTVARMLRLLAVEPGHRVLDVGAGSGWTTALLAHLTGPGGTVVGTELEPELLSWGGENLARTAYTWAGIRQASSTLGVPDEGPYDRILVSAQAAELPSSLLDQLAVEARMVIPVAGEMTLVIRTTGRDAVTRHGPYRFVPLR